jgi:hypothetical protein
MTTLRVLMRGIVDGWKQYRRYGDFYWGYSFDSRWLNETYDRGVNIGQRLAGY